MYLDKQTELTLMQNSHLRPLETNIKGLTKPINWLNTWDFTGGLKEIKFKTLMKPPITHELLSFEELNLSPLMNKIIYIVTIKRF